MKNYFHYINDDRGVHSKVYTESNSFLSSVKEVYYTFNKENTFRGMHSQIGTDKTLTCLNGSFIVYIIDRKRITKNTDDFLQISDSDCYFKLMQPGDPSIYIPSGCSVGYLSLEENSIMLYLTDKTYEPENDVTDLPAEIVKHLVSYFTNISDRDLEAIEE